MADCATWWFDHVAHTYMYALATKGNDPRLQAQEAEKLLAGADDWGKLLGNVNGGKLMSEHVIGVKNLTDSAFAKDKTGIDFAVESLLINAKQQADLYSQMFRDFPLDEFDQLFTVHLTATGGYILALASGEMVEFKSNYNTVLQNRNQLARFWGILCMRLRK